MANHSPGIHALEWKTGSNYNTGNAGRYQSAGYSMGALMSETYSDIPMALALPSVPSDQVTGIARACVARLSPHTQRAYLTHITSYLSSRPYSDHTAHLFPLSREGIQQYLDARKRAGAGPVTLNQALSALKLLSREVWIRGLLPGDDYNAIVDIRSEKRLGKRLGQWTGEQGV